MIEALGYGAIGFVIAGFQVPLCAPSLICDRFVSPGVRLFSVVAFVAWLLALAYAIPFVMSK